MTSHGASGQAMTLLLIKDEPETQTLAAALGTHPDDRKSRLADAGELTLQND